MTNTIENKNKYTCQNCHYWKQNNTRERIGLCTSPTVLYSIYHSIETVKRHEVYLSGSEEARDMITGSHYGCINFRLKQV